MRNRGVSGFGIIILIMILLVLGYVGYQFLRLYLTYGSVGEKVDIAARINAMRSNQEITGQLLYDIKDATGITIHPDSVFIDRTINDSLRIYLAYNDSSDIFGVLMIRRHFVVDKVQATKVRM